MQTAFAIENVNALTEMAAPGSISITVDFQIHRIGPGHVAGVIVTTDYWATTRTVPAVFQAPGRDFEFWRVNYLVEIKPSAHLEFVVFCDDFGGNDTVHRIWNTNGGARFRARLANGAF